MKNFKEYHTEEKEKEQDFASLAESLASEYKGKPESEVIKSILAEAEKGRKEGRLSDADIDNFYNNFSPMLNAVQRKKLKSIIDRLKNC